VSFHLVFFKWSHAPFKRAESYRIWEASQISTLECFENSVIRKSRSNYIDYRSQNFLELNFVSKSFSGSKWLNLGSGFIYIDIENFL
jgi:hypothetical protein